MENPLAEAHEEIKHLEHLTASRLKVAMTLTILAITIVATVGGALAALYSGRQSEAQTARQQVTAAALRAELAATTQEAAVAQTEDDSIEAGWQASFLYQESAQLHDATLKRQLQAQQQRGYAISKQIDRTLPGGGDSTAYDAAVHKPAIRDEELAKAEAERGVDWLGKNNSALAVVSMLALALFLVGLALTINNRRIQLGFTVLSVVMLLFSAGWLGWIAASPIRAPTDSCIDGYTDAVAATAAGHTAAARTRLAAVTTSCSDYSDAWTALGQAAFSPGSAAARQRVEDADQRALATAGASSPVLLNDAGNAALLNHDLPAATRDLEAARSADPDNPVIGTSAAELAAVSGDAAQARADLHDALRVVAQHGAYYRDDVFFPSLRQDVRSFAAADWHTGALAALFRTADEAEASLDSIGSITPATTRGGRITDAHVQAARTIGGVGGFLTISFAYRDLRPGDHLAFRYYTDHDTTYQATASAPDVVVRAGDRVDGTGFFAPDQTRVDVGSVGPLTLEIYLNGVLQARTTYNT